MQELDFYEGLKIIRNSQKPFTVVHTELSLTKNEGGQRAALENVVQGPLRKNMNQEYMIGLQNPAGDVRHIYIHTITELITADGNHYKLILK
jgi:hypothetical protein